MKSAELKTLREALGLTAQETADLFGVALRTIRHWESATFPVKPDVEQNLKEIDSHFDSLAAKYVARMKTVGTKKTVLRRFHTNEQLHDAHPEFAYAGVAHHAALIDRTRRRLEEAGIGVTIDYAVDKSELGEEFGSDKWTSELEPVQRLKMESPGRTIVMSREEFVEHSTPREAERVLALLDAGKTAMAGGQFDGELIPEFKISGIRETSAGDANK